MTFEEIDLLVRRANPVPDLGAPGALPSTGEDEHERARRGTTMQIQDLSSSTAIQHRTGGRFSSGRLPIIAAAAVVAVALVAAVWATGDGEDGIDAAGAPPLTPTAVADSFVASLAGYDTVGAVSHLSAVSLNAAGGRVGVLRDLRWREASGFQWSFDACREVGGGTDHTIVRCPFAFHGIRSAELGLGPFEGSSYRIVVRHGRIDGFAEQLDLEDNGFNVAVWEPFHDWLVANHPGDVSAMFTDDAASSPRTTDESISLWEARSREYVEAAS